MIKRLPNAEFELMHIIWQSEPPVTTNEIMEQLKFDISWKPQTVLTMLLRLTAKGFLKSERIGRERNYSPVISRQEYMNVETTEFISRYRGNSVGSLIRMMYEGRNLSNEDIKELERLLKEKE